VLTNKRYFNRCVKWCYMWLDAFKFTPRAPPTKSETKPRASKRRKQDDEEEDELC